MRKVLTMGIINFSEIMNKNLRSSTRPVESNLRVTGVAPLVVSKEEFIDDVPKKKRHDAEPIKSIDDIQRISEHLIAQRKYRDHMLFICGINFGLRCGDLLQLKVGHFIKPDNRSITGYSFNDSITIIEQKTSKQRTVYLNQAVVDAVSAYLNHLPATGKTEIDLNEYLFAGQTRTKDTPQPMTVFAVERILKRIINDECGISIRASTHCLRKTFGYHVVMGAKDRSRAVEFLQKIFGHSSQAITLLYIGITDEEIVNTYQSLNLGAMDLAKSSGLSEVM